MQVWINFSNQSAVDWWRDEFIGHALDNPLFDGIHWDCSCGMPHGVPLSRAFHDNVHLAFNGVDRALREAGKWSTTWFTDGSKNNSAPWPPGTRHGLDTQGCVDWLVGTALHNNGAGANMSWHMREPHRKGNESDPAPWGYSRRDAVAAFLIMRGPSSFFYFMVAGAYESARMYLWDTDLLEADYGTPVDIVPRVAGSVVTREWTHATVSYDCGANPFRGSIVMKI